MRKKTGSLCTPSISPYIVTFWNEPDVNDYIKKKKADILVLLTNCVKNFQFWEVETITKLEDNW